jgi:hypothetical protein
MPESSQSTTRSAAICERLKHWSTPPPPPIRGTSLPIARCRFAGNSGECCAGDNETDFRHQTAHAFASDLAKVIEQGRVQNRFGAWVLIASPLFLGILREHLSDELRKLVVAEVDKELVHADVNELITRTRDALAASPVETE